MGDGAVDDDAPVVFGGPQRFAVAAFLKIFGESVRMGVDLDAGRAFANGAFHFCAPLYVFDMVLFNMTGGKYTRAPL
jgi:hypothetical protein